MHSIGIYILTYMLALLCLLPAVYIEATCMHMTQHEWSFICQQLHLLWRDAYTHCSVGLSAVRGTDWCHCWTSATCWEARRRALVLYYIVSLVVLGSSTCTRRQDHSLHMTQLLNYAADSDTSCMKSKLSHTQCCTLWLAVLPECFWIQTNRKGVVLCDTLHTGLRCLPLPSLD